MYANRREFEPRLGRSVPAHRTAWRRSRSSDGVAQSTWQRFWASKGSDLCEGDVNPTMRSAAVTASMWPTQAMQILRQEAFDPAKVATALQVWTRARAV